jgi:hypothetical protein
VAPAVTLDQVLDYPYVSALVASKQGDKFAWVEDVHGVRNLWFALASAAAPRQLTHYTEDDGQELTQLSFTSDGSELLYVRGGDHDENWPAQGNLAPNPASSPLEEKVAIWSISIADNHHDPLQIAEGDSPALSSRGQLAYVKDGQIWTARLANHSGCFSIVGKIEARYGRPTEPCSRLSPAVKIIVLLAYTLRQSTRSVIYPHPPISIRTQFGLPTATHSPSCGSPAAAMRRKTFWCNVRTRLHS